MSKKHERLSSHAITGFVLVIIGGLFLLDSLDIFNFGNFIGEWWPVILIIIGLAKFRNERQPGGGILILIGIVFLSATLDIINWDAIWRFWPVILILVGLQIVFRSRNKDLFPRRTGRSVNENYFRFNGIFGGGEHQVTSDKLTGGEALVIFGGIDLDLCGSSPADSGCKINLTAIFGGIDVTVPSDWQIVTSGIPLFGAITNKSGSGAEPDKKTIYIHGTVLFGGIEIKN